MLLRASGQQTAQHFELKSVTDAELDSGVAHSEHLRALTEAVVYNQWLALGEVRQRAEAAMGPQQAVDAMVVAAAFNGITRVADATGIPLDASTAEQTVELRESTGIDAFEYAAKSARYETSER